MVYNKKQYDILTDGNGNDFAFIPNTDLAASGPYLVTIVGANASKADVLIDLAANGNYALIGNIDTVSAIYVEKKALDKGYEYSVHALNQIGLDDQNFLSDASRKVMVNIGKNVRLDTVYVLDAEGNQTVLSESDYVYDPATGFISVSGFGVGAVTFGYTFF